MSAPAQRSVLRQLFIILTPSWFSGLACFLVALVITVVELVSYALKSSSLNPTVAELHGATAQVSASYQSIGTSLSRYQIFNESVLFIFWIGVGLIVYFFLSSIFKAFSSAVNLEQELHYIHAKRRGILKESFWRLIVELIALGIWAVIISFSFHKALPFDLAAARVAGRYFSFVNSFEVLGGVILVAVSLSLQVSCLRMLLLRPRLFGEPTYIEN